MDFKNGDHSAKLLEAQTHILNQTFSFIKSMSLKCAIDLCIPDVIHNYGQPMPLSQIIASLPIHHSKTHNIHHLMRVLTLSGFISEHNVTQNDLEVCYTLTDASILLLKDHPLSITSFLQVPLEPILFNPWFQLSNWLTNEDPTPFHTQNGRTIYDYMSHDPKLNDLFNDGMTSDTRLVSSVLIEKCKGVFEGLESMVDVGGGTGTMAMAIAKSFPQMKCIVFDLPHVVDGLHGTENVEYVGGNMFEAIPSADSIMLKWILHNWNDEECVKILKKCKEAINSDGKVIIIDMVKESQKEDHKIVETQLLFDMQMMVLCAAKERNEKEWGNLFISAGFSNYNITSHLGYISIIQLYP